MLFLDFLSSECLFSGVPRPLWGLASSMVLLGMQKIPFYSRPRIVYCSGYAACGETAILDTVATCYRTVAAMERAKNRSVK